MGKIPSDEATITSSGGGDCIRSVNLNSRHCKAYAGSANDGGDDEGDGKQCFHESSVDRVQSLLIRMASLIMRYIPASQTCQCSSDRTPGGPAEFPSKPCADEQSEADTDTNVDAKHQAIADFSITAFGHCGKLRAILHKANSGVNSCLNSGGRVVDGFGEVKKLSRVFRTALR